MKIGFDAKWLFAGPPSGRRVVGGLIRHLMEQCGEDEVHVFLDARSRSIGPPDGVPADRCHYLWAGNNQLANLVALPRLADRLGLDCVVYQNFVPLPAIARHARVAFVYDVIFDTHPRFFTARERLYFAPMRHLVATADRVCATSASERARLIALRYARVDRVDVVPLGVDDRFVPLESLPAESVERVREARELPDRFVLYAGRLNARKNVSALVRAMALVTTPDLHLVIAGKGDDTSGELLALLENSAVPSRVRRLGEVSDDDLRVLYATATLFCFPSLDEGFGLCPLEAMAAGAPVIASRLPALAEVCGDAAVYIDPEEPHSIATAIDALCGDCMRRTSLRAAGFVRATQYDWSVSARALLASARSAVLARVAMADCA